MQKTELRRHRRSANLARQVTIIHLKTSTITEQKETGNTMIFTRYLE